MVKDALKHMTGRAVLINTKILVLGAGLAIQFTASALGYNLEEYYPLGQGNMWEYSTTDDEGSGKEKSEINGREMIGEKEVIKMLLPEDGDYAYLGFDSEGVRIYRYFDKDDEGGDDEYIIYNPPRIILPDIGKGQTKEYSTAWTEYNISEEKKEEGAGGGQVTLESVENIEVPAGKFTDCLKFSVIYNKKAPGGAYEKSDCDIWLAPGIGKVKEFCIYTEREAAVDAEESSFKIYKLISAVINGKRIDSQE